MSDRVIFRPAAENDLVEIYAYIAWHNPVAAIEVIRKVRSHCMTLSTMPERGPLRESLGNGIRLLIIERKVTVAYRIQPGNVQVMRVFYAGRNIPAQLAGDDDL